MKALLLNKPLRGSLASIGTSCVLGLALVAPAQAVTITVKSNDSFQKGVNDPSPRAPVGGNPGTTLGAQRKFVFQYAADAWGARLGGTVPVVVSATFEALGGTSNSAILGSARPTSLERDFPQSPKVQTWYVAALTNQLTGSDRNDLIPGSCFDDLVEGKCPEIFTRFNSDVDGSQVLGNIGFYYGLDGNGGSDIDFLSVALHEIGHGLGLISLVDPATGKISPNPELDVCQTCSDAYSENLENNRFSPKEFGSMANNQRKLAVLDDGRLVWAGPAVMAASSSLNAGVRVDGAVQVFAPSTYIGGSSISHFDTDVSPDELMEPYSTNPPPRSLVLSVAMMQDLGWTTVDVPECGDPNNDNKTTSGDALLILKGAVGSGVCPQNVCDVNFTMSVTTTDALVVLRRSVGQSISLTCPLV